VVRLAEFGVQGRQLPDGAGNDFPAVGGDRRGPYGVLQILEMSLDVWVHSPPSAERRYSTRPAIRTESQERLAAASGERRQPGERADGTGPARATLSCPTERPPCPGDFAPPAPPRPDAWRLPTTAFLTRARAPSPPPGVRL